MIAGRGERVNGGGSGIIELGGGLEKLVAELRGLEGWPEVEMHAGLLLSETLSAMGVPAEEVVELLGFDAEEYVGRRAVQVAG